MANWTTLAFGMDASNNLYLTVTQSVLRGESYAVLKLDPSGMSQVGAMGDDIAALLDYLKISKADLVGHSFGGASLIAGVTQVNAQIPPNVPPGASVPIFVGAGGYGGFAPQGRQVFVAVQ